MGGIQTISSLPGDPNFNQFNNKYDVASYKRICAEFGVDPSTDFRLTRGANHGLGSIYIYVTSHGPMKTGANYPGYDKFSDEGGKGSDGNLIYFIEQDSFANSQYDWFCPKFSKGLTQAGLSRINQAIEAFVYCVLGSQINVRSSIIGSGGRAKEAQEEFLVLVEEAIMQPDLTKSVSRYQLSIDEAKVRLNLAVCPGAWLMPGRMIINTESTVGYNNQLKQANSGMSIGINGEVNKTTKKVGVTPMSGEQSKAKRQSSHPSFSRKNKDPSSGTVSSEARGSGSSAEESSVDTRKENKKSSDSNEALPINKKKSVSSETQPSEAKQTYKKEDSEDLSETSHEKNRAYLIAFGLIFAYGFTHFFS